MNLETIFHETEKMKYEDNSSVQSSIEWLRKNGYEHYTNSYIEKKAAINLVEVLKINNILNGNELLTLFEHVERLNKSLLRNDNERHVPNRPQSLLLPTQQQQTIGANNSKNRWSCVNSPQTGNRYDVYGNCLPIQSGKQHTDTITQTKKLPSLPLMTHTDTRIQLHKRLVTQPVGVQSTNSAHKHKKTAKSPTNVMRNKSKLIGCTKHNSLTTVVEQHTNDDFSESTNQNEDINKQFFPLNTSDSENSSLFSILSEPNNNTSGFYSPTTSYRKRFNSKMSFNPITSIVPAISLGPNNSETTSWSGDTLSTETDIDLLHPVTTGNRLNISDSSRSSGSNRRAFSSWGYEFELGHGSEELSNDSIDMGEAGRINFRTGSFMTRYRRNSKISNNQISPKPALRTPNQQCINWALCQEETGHSCADNVEEELNPVLDNLISDMDSLDSFRNQMYSRKSTDMCDDSHNKKVSSLRRECKHMHLDIDASSILNQKIEDLINSESTESNKKEPKNSYLTNENQNKKLGPIKSSSTRKRNHPFRWSSLARSNQPDESSHHMEVSHFSLNQYFILKKLSMLRMTSVLEKYNPSVRSQFNWKFPKILSTKTKPSDLTAEVFGVPLSHWQSKIGQPLPPVIYHALKYIRQIGPDADGIFRRAGGKARINELKREIENNPDLMDFSDWQPYDVADMIKSFFRSLPECLMTNKFSTTLISIITYIPEQHWFETIQCGIINLPDENRLVLQSLLYFLSDLAKHSEKTKMTAINLAVCLSPSLFHSPHSMGSSAVSPMRMKKSNQGPDPRDLASQRATHICLEFMIDHASGLFRISEETISKAHLQLDFEKSTSLNKLFRGCNDWFSWTRDRVDSLMSEYHHKFKSWTSVRKDIFKYHQDKDHICQGFEVFYKKNVSNPDKNMEGGNAISTWRITAEIDATPSSIIEKILYKRHEWDPEISGFFIKKEVSDSVDICYMEAVSNPPQNNREMILVRGWQRNIEGHINVIVSQSIDDQLTSMDKRNPLSQRSMNSEEKRLPKIQANVILDDVIIESISSGQKSRINWLSRVDLRGLSSDWYFRQWSHVLIRRIINLKASLSSSAERY